MRRLTVMMVLIAALSSCGDANSPVGRSPESQLTSERSSNRLGDLDCDDGALVGSNDDYSQEATGPPSARAAAAALTRTGESVTVSNESGGVAYAAILRKNGQVRLRLELGRTAGGWLVSSISRCASG